MNSRYYDILIAFDENLLKQSLVLIENILRLSTDEIRFHVISTNELMFNELVSNHSLIRPNFLFYQIDTEILDKYPTSGHISKGAYYILAALDLIQININVLLYVDIDVYFKESPIGIFDYFDNRYAIIGKYLGSSNRFATGLFLINVNKAKSKYTMENFQLALESSNFELNMHDSDLLNLVFENDFINRIPYEWDFSVNRYLLKKTEYHNNNLFLENAKGIHFAGTSKPWRYSTRLPFSREWRQIYHEIYGTNPWNKITTREYLIRIYYILGINPNHFVLFRNLLLKLWPFSN